MPNLPSNKTSISTIEELIADSLGPGALPDFSADQEFLNSLHSRLNRIPIPGVKTGWTWFNGICQGAVAAAFGLILFTGLNILPSIFVNTSVTGAGFAREKVVEVTLRSRAIWQQFILNLENQSRLIIKN
jgi:hypothetical protein